MLYCSGESRVCSASILESLHWLAIFHRINFKRATSAYKIHFNILIDISSSTHTLPVYWLFTVTTLLTRTSVPASRCHRLELCTAAALSAWLHRTWNKLPLPADVLAANSLNVFRRRFKTTFYCHFGAFGGK